MTVIIGHTMIVYVKTHFKFIARANIAGITNRYRDLDK